MSDGLFGRECFRIIACVLASITATGCFGQIDLNATGAGGLPLTQHSDSHEVFLVPVPPRPTWENSVFLVAASAGARQPQAPIVLAVDALDPWRPELVDFLIRLGDVQLRWLGATEPPQGPGIFDRVIHVPCNSAASASERLLKYGWKSLRTVVLADASITDAAHVGATVAGRIQAPLLLADTQDEALRLTELASEMGATKLLTVGDVKRLSVTFAGRQTAIRDDVAATSWLVKQGLPIDYLSVTRPSFNKSFAPQFSVVAPVLAIARRGAVVLIRDKVVWKRKYPATGKFHSSFSGLPPDAEKLRYGRVKNASVDVDFVTGKSSGQFFVAFDHNGDGRVDGHGEGALTTGSAVVLGGVEYAVDVDVKEKRRGRAVWLTTPTKQQVKTLINLHRVCCRSRPTYLCIVGWPHDVPPAILNDAWKIDADLISDAPFAQADSDPFLEYCIGRIVADDLPSASLQVARGLVFDRLAVRPWDANYATAEWAEQNNSWMEIIGLRSAGHESGESPAGPSSPLTDAGLIVHDGHGSCRDVGEVYDAKSDTLLSPCLFETAGCHIAALDQGKWTGTTVATRILRNGALALSGNARYGIAEGTLVRTEFLHRVVAGMSLGEAHRDAWNVGLVTALDRGDGDNYNHLFSLYMRSLLGDPAITLGLNASQLKEQSAWTEVKHRTVVVHPPLRWLHWDYKPLEEWECDHDQLYAWRGVGVGVDRSWRNDGHFDAEEHIYTCEVHTRLQVNDVKQRLAEGNNLGRIGAVYVDEHTDGSRTLMWRCRMLSASQVTGAVESISPPLRFELTDRTSPIP